MKRLLGFVLLAGPMIAADLEDDRALRMTKALAKVEATAVRFERMENSVLGASSLGDLAAVVCRYDKPTASDLFKRSIRLFGETEAGSDSNRKTRYILREAIRCDAALGRDLTEDVQRRLHDDDPSAAVAADVDAARTALGTDLEGARRFGESAAERFGDTDRTASMMFVGFLQRLCEKDPSAADAMFLSTLAGLTAMENPFPHLSALGSYVFMPTGSPQADHWRVSSFNKQRIYWYDEPREGASDSAHKFLSYAATILAAPRPAIANLPYRYVLARQYGGLAQAIAPDLVPVYDGLSSELAAGVPDELLRNQAERRAELGRTGPGHLKEQYEKSTDVAERERYKIGLFTDRLREGEFDRVRKWASAMDDIDARAQARQLADFFEASDRLSRGDVEGLRAMLADWPPGVKRALVYVGLAAASDDSESSKVDLQLAVLDAERFGPEHRPFMLAAVAKELTRVDIDWALTTLQQAVDAFNALDYELQLNTSPQERTLIGVPKQGERIFEPYEIRVNTGGFDEYLDNGYSQRKFDLKVPRVEGFGIKALVQAFREAEPERLEAIVGSLVKESRVAAALAATVEARLYRASLENEPADDK